jgi:thiosulfate dehydrogenase
MRRKIFVALFLMAFVLLVILSVIPMSPDGPEEPLTYRDNLEWPWEAPDSSTIPDNEEGELIRYGRDLVARTAWYLGPQGKIRKMSNGMNCQNCHLEAGTKPWGNNFGAVAATYPKYRERSSMVESIEKKINDCFERSLNGKTLDSTSREMRAMVAWMKWLGKDVPKGKKPLGTGITALPYLGRPASPDAGKLVYVAKCSRCHGANGEGLPDTLSGIGYTYPPLWGKYSYNKGAGLYRISKFAGYVKDNMPFGVAHGREELTDEQAWDVAAFVNSMDRPDKDLSHDWPDIATKPVDHPFGPFADSFSEQQHKYGPFGPIKLAREELTAAKDKSQAVKNK